MLGVGNPFPSFKLKATVSSDAQDAFVTIDNYTHKGKWQVYFFYPKDFTFVCPTEIESFGKLNSQFRERNAQIIGGSIDSEYVHLAWRQSHPALKDLPFPLVSDIKRELCTALGILDPKEGVAQRATFVVDPEGIIRHVSINDLGIGRNPAETLRTIDALQTGELCPANWHKGEKTLTKK